MQALHFERDLLKQHWKSADASFAFLERVETGIPKR